MPLPPREGPQYNVGSVLNMRRITAPQGASVAQSGLGPKVAGAGQYRPAAAGAAPPPTTPGPSFRDAILSGQRPTRLDPTGLRPMAPTPMLENRADSRARQQKLLDQLHGLASGNGFANSAAGQALNQQYQAAAAQNMSNAGSARNIGTGALQRQTMENATQLAGEQRADTQMLKAQQMQSAEQMLAQLYAQQRAGDLANEKFFADTTNQRNRLDDNLSNFYLQSGIGGALEDYNIKDETARANLGLDLEAEAMDATKWDRLLQGLGSVAGYAQKAGGV